ncbi:MAG: phage tail protein [Alphaproteobacteria bacterium]|nr:phage tail protein [Alphaproteobacteria bacterium]
MATLVLTAVGSLVGGPVGGAVGALLGQALDSRLLAPKPRQGPRLGDLAVQISNYGSDIPKLFGTMRVAGTVVWATDLRETRATSGNGKGQPKSVSYTYSASFAVALSARPILGVRRIWADGKLLRGAAGDFKSATAFRLYTGSEDQAPDPLIAAVEGSGGTPAYRGLAYALFEDFQLADYGNRIPSLTFEVDADPGPVAMGEIAAALAEGAVQAGETRSVGGYAASGDSIRAVLEGLGEIAPLAVVDTGSVLSVASRRAGAPILLGSDEGGASNGAVGGRAAWTRKAAGVVPAATSLLYYDAARDYQTGLVRAARGGGAGPGERRAVPAVLGADAAKGFARLRLDSLWAGRETGAVHLAPRRMALRPGAVLGVPGRPGRWRIARLTVEKMVVTAELERLAETGAATLAAQAGRPVRQPDRPVGRTRLVLLDLPSLQESPPARAQLLVAADGAAGWRPVPLSASWDGGASWQAAGASAGPATIGTVRVPPAGAGSALVDAAGSLEVELPAGEAWLESRSDDALAAGANLAAVGDELLQFGAAEPLGGGRFRLTRLLRGRRGTEWAVAAHVAGEPFVLLDPASLAAAEVPLAALGSQVRVRPHGLGDADETPPAQRGFSGESLRPPSPVHLAAARQADGGVRLTWVRRSRTGWLWMSGSDTPLGEEREAYRLTLTGAGGGGRTVETAEPAYAYADADRAADGAAFPLTARVAQLGTAAASREAELIID